MCGIIGARILNKTTEELEFCKKLMEESSIRGLHSFGMCYYDEKGYHIYKHFQKKFDYYIKLFKNSTTDSFIYHNRYSTSGDWADMRNNQPILVDEVGAIAMNGVLTMETKEEYEKRFNVKCKSDNDSEIFLQKMKEGVDIFQFLVDNDYCSFAGVFLQKGRVFALRNNKRPLYYYVSDNGRYFVSTLDIIARAGGDVRKAFIVPTYKIIDVGWIV